MIGELSIRSPEFRGLWALHDVRTTTGGEGTFHAPGVGGITLEQAQRLFAERGFAGVTVAAVAAGAGVSPNLITRYFGGKDGLFLAATRVEISVSISIEGDPSSFCARLAASIVVRWFDRDGEDPLLALLRAAGERPAAAEALAAFFDANGLEPLYRYLRDSGLDDTSARSRAAAIDAFVVGLLTRRRLLRCDLGDRSELELWLGTTIQRLADG